jgi:hypothetical protein
MSIKVTNNAWSILANAISNSATTIVVTTGQGARFPVTSASDYFYGTLADTLGNLEIVKVTNRTADTMTVVRGQDGTTALAFAIGDKFELRPVAAMFNTKLDIADAAATYAPLVSPALTGTPTAPTQAPGDNSTKLATTAFVAAQAALEAGIYAPLASPALTGAPTAPTQLAGDNSTKLATTAFVANYAATVTATYAPVNSPAFTGAPTAPTQTAGDNSTKLATTAFVANYAATVATTYAPINSPAFTGTPTVPTQLITDNSTKAASTAFVQQVAMNAALPNQAGAANKVIKSDGTNAYWGSISARLFFAQGG